MLPLLTPAIEAFIKLAERLITLEKTKLQDRKDLFNEIVKPTFEVLEPVASNYIEFFRRSQRIVKEAKVVNFETAVNQISEARDQMVIARIKVREMAAQIKNNIEDENFAEFADAVYEFFYYRQDDLGQYSSILRRFTRQDQTSPIGSKAAEIVDIAKSINFSDRERKQEFNELLEAIIDELEKNWSIIVKSYEKIKIYALSSPKFIRKSQTNKPKSQ